MVGWDVVLKAPGLRGCAVGPRVCAPDGPVSVGNARGARNVAEILACGLLAKILGAIAEMLPEGGGHRLVTSGSLSVSGKLSKVSQPGALGDPLAWHSASTMRWIAVSMRWRVCCA